MKLHTTKIYTIGYAAHTVESFIETLKNHGISAIADVRSQPYSKFKADFNRENLKKVLNYVGIEYVFLGDYLGARIKAPECYKNGQADYHLISQHPLFITGIDRLLKGIKEYSIALMCAEKDPINCHRTILICKNLKKHNVQICHIINNNIIEEHSKTELRLMKLFNLDQPDLFMSDFERLTEAYHKQEKKIAYVADNEAEYKVDYTGQNNE